MVISRARRGIRSGDFRLLVVCLCSLSLFVGCEKPPTFNELVGNKPAEAPAQPNTVVQPPASPPNIMQPPTAQKTEPPKPAAAEVIAAIERKSNAELNDSDMERLAGLESGIEAMKKLVLSHSLVTPKGLAYLSKFVGVKELSLSNLQLNADSFESISKMPNLEKLDLEMSRFNESDMQGLSAIAQLKEINLNRCQISDGAFGTLAKIEGLEVLRISNTGITGEGFKLFDKLGARNKLRVIEAAHTSFGNNGFTHIRQWKNLEELIIGQAASTDQGMVLGLKGLTNLKRLDVAFSGVGDVGVRAIVPLRHLEYVNLQNSARVSDASVSMLKNLKELRYLNIDGTTCTTNVVGFLKKSIPELKVTINGMTQ